MRSLVILSVAVLPFMAGCSQVPKPATHKMTYQQKFQAAQHWDFLAQDVACQVVLFLNEQQTDVTRGLGIYVEPKYGVFGEAFSNMLVTHLTEAGVRIVGKDEGAPTLSFDVQVIRHRESRWNRHDRLNPGLWTAIATGVRVVRNVGRDAIIPGGVALDLLSGTTTSLPEHEVVITSSLMDQRQYLMRRSDLYYIDDMDRRHYSEPFSIMPGQYSERLSITPKTLEVVAE